MSSPTPASDTFYNYRYINQNATSEEPEEDVQSNIQARRNKVNNITKLHGKNAPTKDMSAIVNLIRIQTETLAKISRLVEIAEKQVPVGDIYSYIFTLTPTSSVVHLDFLNGEKDGYSYNIPAGTVRPYPFRKFFSVTIYNDGPADIAFGINTSPNNLETGARIKANNSLRIDYNYAIIASLNIAPVGGSTTNADIRIIGTT